MINATVYLNKNKYQLFNTSSSINIKFFHKIEAEEILPKSFYKISITLIPNLNKEVTRKEHYNQYPLCI